MEAWIKEIAPNLSAYRKRFWQSIDQTVDMFLIAGSIAFVIGLALGLIMTVTHKDGIKPNKAVHMVLNLLINAFRSVPFLILLIFLIPYTRALVGTAIGVTGAIMPLVFGTVPFFTRQVEAALANVDPGKVEAARSMGSSTWGVILRVYLHEAVPDLIRATTITAISLIGLTTMAGAVGAGGIGSFALNYGNGQNHEDIVNACVLILFVTVIVLQTLGNTLARKTTNRKLLNLGSLRRAKEDRHA